MLRMFDFWNRSIYDKFLNMSATNRMPKTSPRQAVQQICNNSTIRNESTTSLPLYNKSNDWNLSMTKIASAPAKNVRKWRKFVPMATFLKGQQPNFAGIIYAGRPTNQSIPIRAKKFRFDSIRFSLPNRFFRFDSIRQSDKFAASTLIFK